MHIIVRIDEMFGGALLQRAPKQPVEASLRLPGMKPGMLVSKCLGTRQPGVKHTNGNFALACHHAVENGVEETASKAHQSASGRTTELVSATKIMMQIHLWIS